MELKTVENYVEFVEKTPDDVEFLTRLFEGLNIRLIDYAEPDENCVWDDAKDREVTTHYKSLQTEFGWFEWEMNGEIREYSTNLENQEAKNVVETLLGRN